MCGYCQCSRRKRRRRFSLSVYWLYAIGKGSGHKKVAYDFISYAINAKNDKLLTMEGGIGCRRSTWTDGEVNKVVPYYHKLERLHDNVKTLPRKVNWSKISHVIDKMVTELMGTNRPVAELLSEAQDKIDQIEGKI